jgi:hypothetical protein
VVVEAAHMKLAKQPVRVVLVVAVALVDQVAPAVLVLRVIHLLLVLVKVIPVAMQITLALSTLLGLEVEAVVQVLLVPSAMAA